MQRGRAGRAGPGPGGGRAGDGGSPGAEVPGGRTRCGCLARRRRSDRVRIRLPSLPVHRGAASGEARRGARCRGRTRSPTSLSGRVPPTCRRKRATSSSCEDPFMSGSGGGRSGDGAYSPSGRRSLPTPEPWIPTAGSPKGMVVSRGTSSQAMPEYLRRCPPSGRHDRIGTRRVHPCPGTLCTGTCASATRVPLRNIAKTII